VVRKPPGPKAAGLGAELRAIRRRLSTTMTDVARQLDWSEATVSRLETGKRNIDAEDVAALLAIYGVTGAERDRLMSMARTPDEPNWLETSLPGVPLNTGRLASYEANAVRLTDWAPLLIPGLLQTMDYTRSFMLGDGIPEYEIGSRLMARQRRQERLKHVSYTAYIDVSALHRPIGGRKVMRDQLRRIVDVVADGLLTVRVVPTGADAHGGLLSPFLLLEFEDALPRVLVELARSSVFLTGESETSAYLSIVNRLDAVAHDVQESVWLLRSAADTMGRDDT